MATNDRPAGREILLLWGLAIVLAGVGVIFVLSAVAKTEVPPSEAFYDYNSARVEAFAARTADGALGVVMIGDSRLRYSTESDEVLSANLSARLDADVEVLRLVNNWAVFEDFEPLVPLLAEADPSLVIIQNELRTKNRGADAGTLLKQEYLLWRAFGSGPWNPGDLDQALLQDEMRCEVLLDEGVDARRERVFRWVNFEPDGPNAAKVIDFAAELERGHTPVRYLSVPITTEGEAGLPGVEPIAGPISLEPDIEISDELFCDVVHMNAAGRARYTDWLLSAMGDELAPVLHS